MRYKAASAQENSIWTFEELYNGNWSKNCSSYTNATT